MLTVKEAAQRLQVHENTLRTWTDKGIIPVVRRPGGHRRYEADVIERKRHELGFQDGSDSGVEAGASEAQSPAALMVARFQKIRASAPALSTSSTEMLREAREAHSAELAAR